MLQSVDLESILLKILKLVQDDEEQRLRIATERVHGAALSRVLRVKYPRGSPETRRRSQIANYAGQSKLRMTL